jgi:hypothetical protein
VQFHPEKIAFEINPALDIEHSDRTISANRVFSGNISPKTVAELSIYNYPSVYSSQYLSHFNMIYLV